MAQPRTTTPDDAKHPRPKVGEPRVGSAGAAGAAARPATDPTAVPVARAAKRAKPSGPRRPAARLAGGESGAKPVPADLPALKRELLEVRRTASPTREVFNQLTNRELALIDPDETIYFRDIYDHVIRLTDELDNDRELAAATLDVYLTQVNNDLSRIMKRLTGVTVLVAGVGAIAGIFGMSEAAVEAGSFWVVTAVIAAGAAVAAVVLRRIDWI